MTPASPPAAAPLPPPPPRQSAPGPLRDALRTYTRPFTNAEFDPAHYTPPGLPAQFYGIFHTRLGFESGAPRTSFFGDVGTSPDRLPPGEEYAAQILTMTDHTDAMRFRAYVLEREGKLGGMEYPKHRDHAAHTVNNYVLGWYIYSASPLVRQAFDAAFNARLPVTPPVLPHPTKDDYHRFGSIWSLVSLLHDLGYSYEGSSGLGGTAEGLKKARQGAAFTREYFDDLYVDRLTNPVFRVATVARIIELTQISPPPIATVTLAKISDSLNQIDLTHLWNEVVKERTGGELVGVGTPLTAFELWETNYEKFANTRMASRVRDLRNANNRYNARGIPGTNPPVCVVDHGVAGGMLLLHHSTLFFRLRNALLSRGALGNSAVDECISEAFELSNRPNSPSYSNERWWTDIVWGTAAVAFHNIQQQEESPGKLMMKKPLELEEDPLTYLGILVDLLQEWDRPYSNRAKIDADITEVDGGKMELGVDTRSLVKVDYKGETVKKGPKAKLAVDKVRKDLDIALADWDKIVAIA
jgi:hypothetical protein